MSEWVRRSGIQLAYPFEEKRLLNKAMRTERETGLSLKTNEAWTEYEKFSGKSYHGRV